MMESISKLLPPGVLAETFTRRSHSIRVSYANSQFEDISNSRQQATTLRVIKDGRISMAQSSKPDSERELVSNALGAVPFGSEINYEWPGATEIAEMALVDERVNQVATQTMVDIAEDFTQSLLAINPRIRVMAGVARYLESVSLQNSRGFQGEFSRSGWSYGLGGQLVQGDDMLWLGEFRNGSRLVEDYLPLRQEVMQQFAWAKQIAPFSAGSYPALFAPSQVGFLTAPWLACLNGRAVMRDISPWKERLQEQALDARINLVDDGTLPMHPSSQPFDREGVPTRRNLLIERGTVRQFVLDLQSAAALKQAPSGNGSVGGPTTHHVLIEPGQKRWQELLQMMDRGLLILGTMGAWTGNPYSGNVSGTISLGLLVDQGQIVGRVKDCMFSINSFTHFRDHLLAISSDVTDLGDATYPYILLNDVVVATR